MTQRSNHETKGHMDLLALPCTRPRTWDARFFAALRPFRSPAAGPGPVTARAATQTIPGRPMLARIAQAALPAPSTASAPACEGTRASTTSAARATSTASKGRSGKSGGAKSARSVCRPSCSVAAQGRFEVGAPVPAGPKRAAAPVRSSHVASMSTSPESGKKHTTVGGAAHCARRCGTEEKQSRVALPAAAAHLHRCM